MFAVANTAWTNHKMDNSRPEAHQFLITFGHWVIHATMNIKLPSFHFFQDRRQMLTTIQKFPHRRENLPGMLLSICLFEQTLLKMDS